MAFGKLGFGIMAFGILDSSGKCPFRDNVIREMIFGKSYVREIGIREIVRHWLISPMFHFKSITKNHVIRSNDM